MKTMQNRSGFLGINKPRGVSSAFVVNKVKRILRQNDCRQKVGHMGTLDVDADGVLVVAIGNATRLFDLFLLKQKTYNTVFEFGFSTDTDDSTGSVEKTGGIVPNEQQILEAVEIVKKQTEQLPPKFCANVINGRRAYDIARAGEEVILQPKSIKIFDFKLIRQVDAASFEFEITCSSGTYIRSICRDMCNIITTYGITSRITRTKCGVFDICNCVLFHELSMENIAGRIKSMSESLPYIEKIEFDSEAIARLKNGLSVNSTLCDGQYFVDEIMIAECAGGRLKQKIYLELTVN